ncbi:nitrile hydratase accessory protein [Hartmannibacter diazotrophicus]|uniref:Nitrile hydratase accessory protein n=1 Tax=Hartmannibacter diazotrophicus TaxID=1482074 RepID=A0A2C9D8X7_9HYPH|nr:nitrile hydratase accessory protein [Hartmannibacter diazotrophicus]SON56191.1 nitrile hydratase accessory protein [Hartmannibacter diazotrophicus]
MSRCEARAPLAASPGLPKSAEGDPAFAEPWQAHAFALAVQLHETGLFSWGEWAAALSARLHEEGRAEDGSDYFDAWVQALCDLLGAKDIAAEAGILDLQKSWQRAAEATPHGRPIVLENDPERRS